MMKQIFFSLFFTTLACVAFAQNYKVNVSSTSGSYSTSKTVSFNVSWTNRLEGKYNSKVWVLIDYKNLATGLWSRATVTAVSAGSSGSTITAGGRGFWLQGNSGAYNQKVTVTLSGVPAKYNWCAHVSDCPPNATASSGVYTLHGTPPFTLTAADGVTKQIVTGKTLNAASLTIAPTSLADATDCPGIFCPYGGSDLYIDATHICQQRATGAKNWETWIKDSRDNKLYRIVYMPDSRWWMADDLKYRGGGEYLCWGGDCDTYPVLYGWGSTTACPQSWTYATVDMANGLAAIVGASNGGVLLSASVGGTDIYGLSLSSRKHAYYYDGGWVYMDLAGSYRAYYMLKPNNHAFYFAWSFAIIVSTQTGAYPNVANAVRCVK